MNRTGPARGAIGAIGASALGERAHAAAVIARRRILESAIRPGYYVALTAALALASVLVASFVRSLDTSGFDYHLNPLYAVIGGVIRSVFGDSLLAAIFADGPLEFASHLAALVLLAFVSITSVHRLAEDAGSGTLALHCCGPCDGTAYVLASVARDAVLTCAGLALILVFCVAAARVENLALTPPLWAGFLLLPFLSLSVSAYGALISIVTRNPTGASTLQITWLVALLASLVGSYSEATGYARGAATAAAWLLQWFSPFYYWSIGIGGARTGLALGLLGLILLPVALLTAIHLIVRRTGVRP